MVKAVFCHEIKSLEQKKKTIIKINWFHNKLPHSNLFHYQFMLNASVSWDTEKLNCHKIYINVYMSHPQYINEKNFRKGTYFVYWK